MQYMLILFCQSFNGYGVSQLIFGFPLYDDNDKGEKSSILSMTTFLHADSEDSDQTGRMPRMS